MSAAETIPYDEQLYADLEEKGPPTLQAWGTLTVAGTGDPARFNAVIRFALWHELDWLNQPDQDSIRLTLPS